MVFFRFVFLTLKRLIHSKKITLFDPCTTHFVVNPLDLDINFHMNNGRYLSIMDLGRFDLMFKSGTFWPLFKKGFFPVVVSESIRFKRSLQPFERFQLLTQLESWDEKDFYISQKFISQNQTVAVGYIKGRFKKRGRKGSIPTQELFQELSLNFPGVQVSKLARNQFAVEASLNQLI
jgi:acyl-CoA thioesterase FadM